MTTSAADLSRQSGFPGGATLVMSVYARDSPELFRRALASSLDAPQRPEAAVLVVDGPVGAGLEAVIAAVEERPGVTLVRLPRNVGLAAALNAGLERVDTAWVLRADADDVNAADRFERQARFANEHPDVALFGGAIAEVDPTDGKVIAHRTVPLGHEEIRRRCATRNPFNHMTVAFRTEPVRAVGGYPLLHLREDYGLWALLLQQGVKTGNLSDVLVMATTGRDMYRRRGGWRYATGEWALQAHLVRCGLKAWPAACVHGALRSLVFLMPAALRGWVYERTLRQRA
jgi:glycosyltransferase involved in cell wall biosynthesis